MLVREEARLRSLLHRLVLVSLAAAPAACSSSTPDPSGIDPEGGAASAPDATSDATGHSPGGDRDASAPSGDDAGTPGDATVQGNDSSAQGADGGTDASHGADATLPDSGPSNDDAGDSAITDSATCSDPPEFLDGADDGSGCDYFLEVPCGLPPDSAVENCYLLLTQCLQICGHNVNCQVAMPQCNPDAGGTYSGPGPVKIECGTFKIGCGSVGRRPDGLVEPAPVPASDPVGAWFAEVAHLEAASITAFRRLRRELQTHGAPRRLVHAAARSARDEVRHARTMTRLARRHGASPARVQVDAPPPSRSLEALARENAVEGCVRETFGALVALRQSLAARDPELRRDLARVARDETRHAALARQIAKWVAPRLSAEERARVAEATRDAVAALRCEAAQTPEALAHTLGLPTGPQAVALVDAFAASVIAAT
jgi:hypothetical protein